MTQPATRRQRLHDATVAEIKAVARDLMAREGTSSLNLRAIAREMGMTPSALYRYFPSRDAILTALIKDAYDSVGESVERAVAEHPDDGTATGMLAAVHAFRRWALEHPQEYGLIYGTPVPGYEAPEEETVEAAMRTNFAMLGQLIACVEAGHIRLPPPGSIPESVLCLLDGMAEDDHKAHLALPREVWAVAMQFWVVLLGAINAEVFGHLPLPLRAGAGDFFDHTMRRALAVIGVDQDLIDKGISPQY